MAASCTGPGEIDGTEESLWELPRPRLDDVGPNAIVVGDRLRVAGDGLVEPGQGALELELTGAFADERGAVEAYVETLPLRWREPGVADLHFGPGVLFSRHGDRIGVFRGEAVLINRDEDERRASEPLDVEIEVLPSILLQELRSTDLACAEVTDGTIPGANVALRFRAIGLGELSAARPLGYRVVADAMQADAPSGSVAGADVSVQLSVGQLLGPGPMAISLRIEATDPDGHLAARVVPWHVYPLIAAESFRGAETLVERTVAEQVSSCLAGGDIGRDLVYSEGTSIGRTRSIALRWSAMAGQHQGLSAGICLPNLFNCGTQVLPFVTTTLSYEASWSTTFAVDEAEIVSSEEHRNLSLSTHILPGHFGASYRQVERLERTVPIVMTNTCGYSELLGEAVLTDWNIGFDVATGPSCPPPTNLPPPG